ncbi:MAG: hypothetical protein ABI876_05020 [Bacteroidota bacterium]
MRQVSIEPLRLAPGIASLRRIAQYRDDIAAVSAGLIAGIIYFLTQTNRLTEDSVEYAAAATRGGLEGLLHPHHLLFNPLLAAIYAVVGGSGATRQTLAMFQGLSILVSAVTIALVLLALRRMGCSLRVSSLLAAIFALGNGFWLYSSQIEVYNIAALCMIAAVAVSLIDGDIIATGRRALPAAIFTTLAMLFHQTAIFFVLALLVYGLRTLPREARRGFVLRSILPPLAVVGALYVAATWSVLGSIAPGTVFWFATSYAHTGWWGGIEGMHFPKAIYGLADTVLAIDNLRRVGVLGWGAMALGVAGTVVAIRGLRAATKNGGASVRYLSFLIPWIIAHAAFVWWWYPSNIEFWIVLMPALFLLAGSLLRSVAAGSGGERMVTMGLGLAMAGMLGVNAPGILADHANENRRLSYSQEISSISRSGDLFISTGQGALASYLRYFSPSKVLTVHGYCGVEAKTLGDRITDELIHRLELDMRGTIARNGRVLAEEGLLNGGIVTDRDLQHFDRARFNQWVRALPWHAVEGSRGRIYMLTTTSDLSVHESNRSEISLFHPCRYPGSTGR